MQNPPRDPLAWIDDELDGLAARNLFRAVRTHDGPQQPLIRAAGKEFVNFGSNDYLGLAADPRLAAAAAEAAMAQGCGAGASPLVTGHVDAHRQLELALAQFEEVEAALLFPSGYAANQGAIAALAGRGDTIYADEKNHASMIDGCRLSRAEVCVYPHGDARALEAMLAKNAPGRRRLIATESVFSMDGDLAPLVELAELAEAYGAMLLVDEAHATGVFGARGRGLAEQLGVERRVQVRVGTLSKALGGGGGFVCGSRRLIDWLVNSARPYVFSTALAPPVAAAAAAALDVVRQEPERRTELLAHAAALRTELAERGWSIGASASQIIPLLAGEPATALGWAEQLRSQGLLVPAIRPPSVPAGQSLLRISLSWAHTPEMIARLVAALDGLVRPVPTPAAALSTRS
ncbi:MAG: 8-amino-7-oxononanoate synthase [Pirellulales bacterium]